MAGFSDIALRILLSTQDDTAPGLARAREGIQSISTQLKALETVALRFLNFHIFVGFAQEVQQTADKVATLEARLRLVTKTAREYAVANRELFRVAQEARSSLEATIKVDRAVRQLNGSQQWSIDITEAPPAHAGIGLGSVGNCGSVTRLPPRTRGSALILASFSLGVWLLGMAGKSRLQNKSIATSSKGAAQMG